MSVTIDRLVRNQLLFREVNDRIREVIGRLSDSLLDEADFVCECSNPECVTSVQLRLEEYEAVRSSPRVFVIAPGHETLEVEHVVESNNRFALVEKTRRLELVEGDYRRAPSIAGSS